MDLKQRTTTTFTLILLLILFSPFNNNNNNFINYFQSQGVRIPSPSATSSLNINSNRSLTLLLSSHRHYWKQRVDESKEEDQSLIVDEVWPIIIIFQWNTSFDPFLHCPSSPNPIVCESRGLSCKPHEEPRCFSMFKSGLIGKLGLYFCLSSKTTLFPISPTFVSNSITIWKVLVFWWWV